MTPDSPTRDRLLDEALRRVMGESTPAPAGPECLDAEVLAAWLDGGLDEPTLATIEAHAASCARCRDLAAALAAEAPAADTTTVGRNFSDRTPVTDTTTAGRNFSDRAPVTDTTTAGRNFSDRTPVTDTTTVGRNFSDRAPVTDTTTVGRNFSSAAPNRAWRWWLAPLAAAAAVAAWMVVPGAPPTPQAPETQLAQAPAAAPLPPEAEPAPALEKQAPTEEQDRTAALRLDRTEPARDARADEAGEAAGAAQPKEVAKAAPPTLAARSDEAALPAPEAAAQAVATPAAPARQRAAFREIASPDRAVRWRIGDGVIERTSDGGGSWARASVEAATGITAGAAPSVSVCWLVGREGLVLVTTDGSRFARVAFPVAVDLVFVQATDGRAATITTADAERWATSDGGHTWTKR